MSLDRLRDGSCRSSTCMASPAIIFLRVETCTRAPHRSSTDTTTPSSSPIVKFAAACTFLCYTTEAVSSRRALYMLATCAVSQSHRQSRRLLASRWTATCCCRFLGSPWPHDSLPPVNTAKRLHQLAGSKPTASSPLLSASRHQHFIDTRHAFILSQPTTSGSHNSNAAKHLYQSVGGACRG